MRVGQLIAEGFRDEAGKVHYLDIRLFLVGAHPELEFAAGTEGEDFFRTRLGRLVYACLADLRRYRWILDERQNAAAAVGFLVVMCHLDEFYVRICPYQVPRRFINAGDTADMAGVVEGDGFFLPGLFGYFEFSFRYFLRDDFGVMLRRNIVFYSKLLRPFGICMPPHHIAGGTGADDGVRAGVFHRFDVFSHRLLEELPFARDEHRRGAAALFLAEEGEVHASFI